MMTQVKTEENSRLPGWLVAADNPVLKGWHKFLKLLLCLNLIGMVAVWASASKADPSAGSELVFKTITESDATAKSIPAMALSSKISTVITGHIVRTIVLQRFKNPSKHWVEGVYYFPLPDGAAVDAMTLKVGERLIKSEIKEKAEAQKTFNKAAAEGKVAALLDQYRPNTFSTRVANVEPGSEVSVEISFQTLAVQDGAHFSYVMPQSITPRYNPGSDPSLEIPEEVNGDFTPEAEFSVLVKQGAKLADISSDTHMILKQERDDGDVLISLVGGAIPANKDFALGWHYEQEALAKTILFEEKFGDEQYLLGIVMPPKVAPQEITKRRDVTFILDISGSMQGAGIEQGRKALRHALDQLRTGDRFQVIVFNDAHQKFFRNSVAATAENLSIAKDRIAGLQADRGTEMYPALQAALLQSWDRSFDRQIVFLTDGAVTNEEEMFALVNEKLDGARLFTVGLGYAPNSWFMRKSAEFGRGIHIQIDDVQLAAAKLSDLFDDMAKPTLRNVQLNLGEGSDTYPRLLPDLYGDRPVIFLSRATGGASEIALKAQQADEKFLDLSLQPNRLEEQVGISKLWAKHKVEGLMDAKVRGMDAEFVREGVLNVALTHQIMSPYTSFVAVDKTPARVQEDFLKKAKLDAAAPPRLMASASHVQTLATATPMKEYAIFGLLAILSAILMHIFLMKGGVRK